jgi:cleavage and polyadenylation specificity factor subunit 2
MASIVKFTPITGSFQESCPVSYLLEIDSQKLLLDCGILPADGNGKFRIDEAYLKALKKIAKTVDVVLLSHGDLKHCGALPLIVDFLSPNVPVYATVPVHHMGLMTLYDTLQSLEPFTCAPFGYDQVDAAFDRIQRIRYSQPVALAGSVNILALPAGHSIGGSLWRIRKAPAEDILYCPAFNHKREAHLDGAVFDAISRPSLMIIDASQSLAPAVVRKDRDAGLFTALAASLRAGGSVLIPCDSSLRLLELAFVIESRWSDLMVATRVSARAYILTHQAYRTVEFAKGMLEWMSQSVMKVFDTDRTNPFDFKHLRLIHSLEEISSSTPAVILASSEYLDFGLSHALLASFTRSSSNSILTPFEPLPGSLLARLLNESNLNEIKIKVNLLSHNNSNSFLFFSCDF